MKKLISLLLSIIIVFSATCYSTSALYEFNDEIDADCAKNFDLFKFDESCYNEELSEGVAEIDFPNDEYSSGEVFIEPDSNVDTTKVYFNIEGTNYLNLLKAHMALQQYYEDYDCESTVYICDNNDKTTAVSVKLSLLDENLETKSSTQNTVDVGDIFGIHFRLKPVTAKYLCVTMRLAEKEAEFIPTVCINKISFIWFYLLF